MTEFPIPDDERRDDVDGDGVPVLPERRLMAEGLPDWDLEPPTTLIRRPGVG
jgi:hypothetical protein